MKSILFTFREKSGSDMEFITADNIENAWLILAGVVEFPDDWELQGGIE